MKEAVTRLLAEGGRSFWSLAGRWEYRLKDLVDALNEMHEQGEVSVRNGTIELRGGEKLRRLKEHTCRCCRGRGIEVRNTSLLRRFRQVLRDRPHTTAEYFQGNMDAESVVARVFLMDARDGLAGRRVCMVGDDDYLSLALGLTHLPERIYVLEIDERIGEFIERCARRYGMEIEFLHYSVEDPLPRELRRRCHIFSTEPLETLSGFLSFFARGAGTLAGRGCSGYVGLTNLECSLSKWKRIQEEMLRMGFVITEVRRRFSSYPMEYPEDDVYLEQVVNSLNFRVKPNRKGVWYFSHLFRVEAVEQPSPSPAPDERAEVRLFDPGDDMTYPNSGRR